MSSRTLYKYYPTKEDLYSSLLDELLDQTEEKFNFVYSKELTIEDKLKEILKAKVELALSDSYINISKIVISGLLKSRKPTKEQMDRIYESESVFVTWVKKAQKNKKVTQKISPDEIASQFHAIFKSQIYWPVILGITNRKDLTLKKIKKSIVDFFINSFCT